MAGKIISKIREYNATSIPADVMQTQVHPYKKAAEERGKSFGESMTEELLSGSGIGKALKKTIQKRTQAKIMGMKESFDPMNLAKKLTGGSNFASALVGKLTGRSTEDMQHFVNPEKTKSQKVPSQIEGDSSLGGNSATEALGLIYREMVRHQAALDEQKLRDNKHESDEEKLEEDRNKELIKALTGRRSKKPKEEPSKEVAKKEEPTKKQEPKKEQPKTEPKTEAKTAPKAEPKVETKAPPKAEPKTTTAPKVEKVSTQAPKPSAVSVSKGVSSTISSGSAVIASITSGLIAAGITNKFAQNAILANVGKETGFKPRTEDLKAYSKTSNDRIRKVFTTRVSKYSDAELDEIKKSEYKFGEAVYGKDTKIGQSMGNTEEGDGYKYRGRGSIQLTGKNNYKAYSSIVGMDLVKNPDSVNIPEIDAKIVAAFVKRGTGGKLDFKSQAEADRAVTQAIGGKNLNLDAGIGSDLLSKVSEYSTALNTGSQIDSSSKENKELKTASNDRPSVSSTTTNVTNNTVASQSPQKQENDRPAILKKVIA